MVHAQVELIIESGKEGVEIEMYCDEFRKLDLILRLRRGEQIIDIEGGLAPKLGLKPARNAPFYRNLNPSKRNW